MLDVHITLIDAWWAETLGCTADDLRAGATLAVEHSGTLRDYAGVYAVRRCGGACVVSLPPPLFQRHGGTLGERTPVQAFDAAFLGGLAGDACERVIGPAWVGYADASDVRAVDDRGAGLLTPMDDPALLRLRDACTATEWEHGGVKMGGLNFGLSVDDEMVSAGRLEARGEHIWDVGIVTHPMHRGQGYGKAVAGAMTAHGLASRPLMQYQTLRANAPSMAIARSLDYVEIVNTISVRLRRID